MSERELSFWPLGVPEPVSYPFKTSSARRLDVVNSCVNVLRIPLADQGLQSVHELCHMTFDS